MIDSFIVISIVFASINNATLLKMFLQLLSFSFDANSSSIVSITTFVASVMISITIFQMIKIVDDLNMNDIVDDSNMNDIDVMLKKFDHAQ